MQALIALLTNIFQRRWHRPVFLLTLLPLLALITFLAVSGFASRAVNLHGWIATILVPMLGLIAWLTLVQLPKVPKGRLGIAISLECDDDDHASRIGRDFIGTLRTSLQASGGSSGLSLVALPRWAVADINDAASASRYVRKVRAHFIYFGTVRLRTIRGKPTHIVHVEGLVLHGPTPLAVQQKLSEQMGEVIPRRLMVPLDNDALIFEATSAVFYLSARFIIGMAAYVSGAVGLAEGHLLYVERGVKNLGINVPSLKSLGSNVARNLKSLYRDWLKHLITSYTLSREDSFLKEADTISTKLLERAPRDQEALTAKAMCEVVLRGNISEARSLVLRCEPVDDPVRRYNLAFLAAFQGDLKQARSHYKLATEGALSDVTVPIQCEEFIHLMLEKFPERYQLYYCLGIINFFAKQDWGGAVKDLKEFLDRCPENKYIPQNEETKQLVEEAEHRSGNA